jgi:cytochrome b6-f complex iron-sulfur subunit
MKRRRWLMGLFTAFLAACQNKGTKDGFAEFVSVAVLDEAGSVLQDYFSKDPIVVVRDPQDPNVIHAVNAFCTHQRCLVNWDKAQKVFICPCHGSTFGADGKYLQGVATQPLQTFPAKIDGKSVWVKA